MRRAGQQARAPPQHRGPPAPRIRVSGGHAASTRRRCGGPRPRPDCGVAMHEVLLAAGWVSQDDYAAALARAGRAGRRLGCRLDLAEATSGRSGARPAGMAGWAPVPRAVAPPRPRPTSCSATSRHCASGASSRPGAAALDRCGAARRAMQAERIDRAVRGLLRDQPASSATRPRPGRCGGRQPVGLAIGGVAVVPGRNLAALTALIAAAFPVRHAAAAGGARQALAGPAQSAPGSGRHRRARPRLAAAGLHRAGAAVARGQRAARPRPLAARPRLSGGQARSVPGPRGRRRRDAGGLWRLALPGNFRVLVVPDQGRAPSPRR